MQGHLGMKENGGQAEGRSVWGGLGGLRGGGGGDHNNHKQTMRNANLLSEVAAGHQGKEAASQ